MTRLIYAIPTWLIFIFGVQLPLILLGWILIPIAALCKAYKAEGTTPDTIVNGLPDPNYHFTWPFMYIWDNVEDGIANNNYSGYTNMFMRIVSWSANRNPVNNLRVVPYLTCMIDPKRVGFCGSLGNSDDYFRDMIWQNRVRLYDTHIPQWFFCWQGVYTDWYWQFNFRGGLYRFWIGFKIYPTDIWGVTPYRVGGTGFGLQFNTVIKSQ